MVNNRSLAKSVSFLIVLSVLSFCVSYQSSSCSRIQRIPLQLRENVGIINRASRSTCGSITNSRRSPTFLRTASSSSSSSSSNINSKADSSKNIFKKLLQPIIYPIKATKSKFNEIKSFFDIQLPMMQYLWPKDNLRLRLYLILSMVFMFLGKWFNVKVPFILQRAIDTAAKASASAAVTTSITTAATTAATTTAATAFSLGTLIQKLNSFSVGTKSAAAAIAFYGISRALSVICSEIKTCLFAHVSQNVLRKFANNIFSHLHSLDSEFHLQTPSGVISVAYVRAVRGFQTMLFQLVFSVLPTMLELALVSNILYNRCGSVFAAVTLTTFTIYLAFTVWITQWRIDIRKELVDCDNKRNGFFIDSILNHEVVKLFTNEKRETVRFDGYLEKIQNLSIESTYAIAVLNLGQAAMFCVGLTTSLLIALNRVQAGTMSVGDLVAVNSMLLQLSIPFNFMGFTCKSNQIEVLDY